MADLGVSNSRPETRSRLNAVPLVAGLTVIALLALFFYGLKTQRLETGIIPRPNTVAPNFELTSYTSQPMRLSDYRGKVVVLNFWASWCIPCQDEQPDLEALAKRYQNQGVVFLGINIQDNEHDGLAFIHHFGVTYPVAPDPTGAVYINYGVVGIPETYVISRQGTIAQKLVGPVNANQLAVSLEGLLH